MSTGLADCSVKFTPEKALAFPLTADYGGDSAHGPGHSSTLVTTLLVGTKTQLTCSPNPAQAGAQVDCSAVLTGAAVSPNAQKAQFEVLASPIEGLPLSSLACNFTAPTATIDQWSETCTTSFSALSVGNYETRGDLPRRRPRCRQLRDHHRRSTSPHATSTQVSCLPGTPTASPLHRHRDR